MNGDEHETHLPQFALISGQVAQPGDRVRLHPHARADAFDMLLDGMTARIEAVREDLESRVYLVVALDDDPGKEQEDDRVLPGHRFFFFPNELELLTDAEQSGSGA